MLVVAMKSLANVAMSKNLNQDKNTFPISDHYFLEILFIA
jgi:hypothetical protein